MVGQHRHGETKIGTGRDHGDRELVDHGLLDQAEHGDPDGSQAAEHGQTHSDPKGAFGVGDPHLRDDQEKHRKGEQFGGSESCCCGHHQAQQPGQYRQLAEPMQASGDSAIELKRVQPRRHGRIVADQQPGKSGASTMAPAMSPIHQGSQRLVSAVMSIMPA